MRLDEFYSPEEDKSVKFKKTDTRKQRLTLEQLNKLRKLRELKKAENTAHDKFCRIMYGATPEDDGGL